jgi:hypothetical protein
MLDDVLGSLLIFDVFVNLPNMFMGMTFSACLGCSEGLKCEYDADFQH